MDELFFYFLFLHFDQRFTSMTQWWSISKSVTLEEKEQEATAIIIDTIVTENMWSI